MAVRTGNPYIDALGGNAKARTASNTSLIDGDLIFTFVLDNTNPNPNLNWTTFEAQQFGAALTAWSNVAKIDALFANRFEGADYVERKVATLSSPGRHDDPGDDTNTGEFRIGADWNVGTLTVGGVKFDTLVHELGHAFGLAHPHDNGQGTGTFPTTGTDLDERMFTIMSYDRPAGRQDTFGNVATPMAFDIAAIQIMYGARAHFNEGDDTYWMTDFGGAGDFYSCIWDTRGNDTIAYGGTRDATIDLRSATLGNEVGGGGFLSEVDGIVAGYTIAGDVTNAIGNVSGETGVIIENARGGSGHDTITGNRTNNRLEGGAGNDTIHGGAGIDILDGGDGEDTLNGNYPGMADGVRDDLIGGAGNDRYFVLDTQDKVYEYGWADTGDVIFTTVTSFSLINLPTIEQLVFIGVGTFVGTGNEANNAVCGATGNDFLYGRGGHDWIDGGAGADRMYGGTGDDTFTVDHIGDRVFEDASVTTHYANGVGVEFGGIDTVRTSLQTSYRLEANVENLEYTNDFSHTGLGNTLNNRMTGGGGMDTLTGDAGHDHLIGNGGNDTLRGGMNNDTLEGGANNDTLFGDSHEDTLDGGSGIDTLDGGTGNDVISGGDGADVIRVTGWVDQIGSDKVYGYYANASFFDNSADTLDFAGLQGRVRVDLQAGYYTATDGTFTVTSGEVQGIENVTGGNSIDTLIGNDTGNILDGGANNDTLEGGAGNDILNGGGGQDTFAYADGWNRDAIVDFRSGEDIIDLTRVTGLTSFNQLVMEDTEQGVRISVQGNADHTIGLVGVFKADLSAGDFLIAGQADPRAAMVGTEDTDYLNGNNFANAIDGLGGADVIDGRNGKDNIRAGAGNDLIKVSGTMAAGLDQIDGGADVDTLDASEFAGHVTVNLVNGSYGLSAMDGSSWAVGAKLITGIENLTGGAGNDKFTGDTKANYLKGGLGDDTLLGGGGNDILEAQGGRDTLDGGAGDDYLFVSKDTLKIVGGAGWDGVIADETTIADGFKFRLLGAAVEYVAGNAGNDVIDGRGLATAMTLSGGAGNDTLYGSNGQTTFWAGDGDDVMLGGNALDQFVGGAGNDVMTGGRGADRLDGGDGDDILNIDNADAYIFGGNGYDIVYADASTTAGFRFAIGSSGVEKVYGNTGADVIDASGAADLSEDFRQIYTGAGNDRVIAGSGNYDWIVGGQGTDTTVFAGARADYTIFAERASGYAGWTVVYNNTTGALDWLMSVEKMQFSDQTVNAELVRSVYSGTASGNVRTGTSAAEEMYGLSGNDVLNGGGGDDIIDGGAGADQLLGGEGDDILFIDGLDIFDGGAGIDQVYVDEARGPLGLSFDLAASNVETVYGGNGNDRFDGASSAVGVELNGLGGDDVLIGSSVVHSSLLGGSGHDTLRGGASADYLLGGSGNDDISGGGGSDTFVFEDGFGRDVIRDFETGVDRIEMTAVSGLDSFDQFAIVSGATGAEISFAGQTIVLQGIDAALVSASDFIL